MSTISAQPQPYKPPAWIALAKQVTQEHDSKKLLDLVDQLCKALKSEESKIGQMKGTA